MEAADRQFCKGIDYLCAALNLEGLAASETELEPLARLARVYRERGLALISEGRKSFAGVV